MELIDKSAVIAEIKKLRKRARELYGCSQFDTAYDNVLESIDTLETKEVDFERELSVNECIEYGEDPSGYYEIKY